MTTVPQPFLLLPQWYERQDLSAAELAARMGVHEATVHELLRERRWPSGPTLLGLHQVVGDAVDIHFSLRNFVRNRRIAGAGGKSA